MKSYLRSFSSHWFQFNSAIFGHGKMMALGTVRRRVGGACRMFKNFKQQDIIYVLFMLLMLLVFVTIHYAISIQQYEIRSVCVA